MKRVYVVNASILDTSSLWLFNSDDESTIEELFTVYAKGNDEWFLGLDKEVVRASNHPMAKIIIARISDIGRWRSKNCGSDETERRIHDETWDLVFLWG